MGGEKTRGNPGRLKSRVFLEIAVCGLFAQDFPGKAASENEIVIYIYEGVSLGLSVGWMVRRMLLDQFFF